MDAGWKVLRQDDNGNTFVIMAGLSMDAAQALKAEYESHGHKQLYWIEKESTEKKFS